MSEMQSLFQFWKEKSWGLSSSTCVTPPEAQAGQQVLFSHCDHGLFQMSSLTWGLSSLYLLGTWKEKQEVLLQQAYMLDMDRKVGHDNTVRSDSWAYNCTWANLPWWKWNVKLLFFKKTWSGSCWEFEKHDAHTCSGHKINEAQSTAFCSYQNLSTTPAITMLA